MCVRGEPRTDHVHDQRSCGGVKPRCRRDELRRHRHTSASHVFDHNFDHNFDHDQYDDNDDYRATSDHHNQHVYDDYYGATCNYHDQYDDNDDYRATSDHHNQHVYDDNHSADGGHDLPHGPPQRGCR